MFFLLSIDVMESYRQDQALCHLEKEEKGLAWLRQEPKIDDHGCACQRLLRSTCYMTRWGLCAYVIVDTKLPPSPVIREVLQYVIMCQTHTWFVARHYVKFWFCNILLRFGLTWSPKTPSAALHLPPHKESVCFPSPCAQIEKVRVTPNHKTTKVRKNSATSRDRSEAGVYVVYVPR